ncbi:DUF3219 family protein [Ammoniphilus sp. CFH 90114]|nr:DUF3219 family protein [Ammoniphilus sp. CFH 90114]
MVTEVFLDEVKLKVTDYRENVICDPISKKELHHIAIEFKVTSEEYHKVTTLLYEQNFNVKVPLTKLEFRGTIANYSTSITNLYKEDEVGIFKLELMEMR